MLIAAGIVVVVILAWVVAGAGGRGGSAGDVTVPRNQAGVRQLVTSGNRIAAIKLLRELSGLGLKEAKDAIDEMGRTGRLPELPAPTTPAPALAPGDDAEIVRLVAAGNSIGAIKRYRELSGLGLHEAKAAIDRMTSRG